MKHFEASLWMTRLWVGLKTVARVATMDLTLVSLCHKEPVGGGDGWFIIIWARRVSQFHFL